MSSLSLTDSRIPNVLSRPISEQTELERCINALKKPDAQELEDADRFVKGLHFPIFKTLFDESGLLNDTGRQFIDTFDNVSPDIRFYFSFIPQRNAEMITNLSGIARDPVTPLFTFRFVDLLFEAFSSIPNSMNEDKIWFSRLLKEVVMAIKTLALLHTIDVFYEELARMIQKLNPPNLAIFNNIVIDSILAAAKSDGLRMKPDGLDRLDNDLIEFNTFMNQCGVSFQHEWIYSVGDEPDIVHTAIDHMMLLSRMACDRIQHEKPLGSTIVNLEFQWKKDAAKTQQEYTGLELKYCNARSIYNLDSQCFVLPVFAAHYELKVSMVKPKKKYVSNSIELLDGSMIDKGPSFTLKVGDKSRTERIRLGGCNCVVSFDFMEGKNPIGTGTPVPSGDRLLKVFDVLTDALVTKWIADSRRVKLIPSQTELQTVLELCIQFAIPAPRFFVTVIEKLLKGWCLSSQYLSVVTLVFLILYVTVHKCVTTTAVHTSFEAITDFLKEKLAESILIQLSKPGLVERSSFVPLLVLMSFIIEDDRLDECLDSMKGIALKNIVREVGTHLHPTDGRGETTEEVRRLLTFTAKSSGNTFSRKDLSDTLLYLVKRAKEIDQFYESVTMPVFLDLSKDVDHIFAQFGKDICAVFSLMPPEKESDDVGGFITAYGEYCKQFHMEMNLEPYVASIEARLDKIGRQLKEYANNAVDHDNFVDMDPHMHTSTSLNDMFTLFYSYYQFLERLGWADEGVYKLISKYFRDCVDCAKMYCKRLIKIAVVHFAREHVGLVKLLEEYMPKKGRASMVPTKTQVIVVVNDLIFFRRCWSQFLERMRPRLGGYEYESDIIDPGWNIADVIRAIQQVLSISISEEVTTIVKKNLWELNRKTKRVFCATASKYIVNRKFLDHNSEYYHNVYDSVLKVVTERIDALADAHCLEFNRKLLNAALVGFDIGLVNVLIAGKTSTTVKSKRLATVMEFLDDVRREAYDYIVEKDPGYTEDQYDLQMKFSKYLLAHANSRPEELLNEFHDLDEDMRLCASVLITSELFYSRCANKFAYSSDHKWGCRLKPRFVDHT